MSGLFSGEAFAGFGLNRLHPDASVDQIHRIDGKRSSQLRARVRQECPRHPGVYGMVNAHGELIYVGKAKSLRARLLSYFRPKSRDPKAGRILSAARLIAWEYAPSEFAALLRELELIRRWRPVFNVQGQPRSFGRTYICLGRRPAPYLFLSRKPSRGVIDFWGPVYTGQRASAAIRRLNDCFGLRDCPQKQQMIFAEQAELFPLPRAAGCLRHEIGTCLGPCIGACSRTAYADRVQALRAFLDGKDTALLTQLQADMQTAAAALAFERAAVLREKVATLDWLHRHLERVRRASREFNFVYPVAGHGGQDLWYIIRRGWAAAVAPVPRDEPTRQQAAEMIQSVFGKAAGGSAPAQPEEVDGLLLVAAWFRKRPGELARTLDPTAALARTAAVASLTGEA